MTNRAIFSTRVIPGIDVDRAKWRNTFMYRVTDDLMLGVEFNPLALDVGPLANWRFLDESDDTPAMIVGTSSDRIGTPAGRSVYLTVSKSFDDLVGIPVSPYVGTSYGTFNDEFTFIGGMSVDYGKGFSSMHLYDGRTTHHMINYTFDDVHTVGLILVDYKHVGLMYGISFDF